MANGGYDPYIINNERKFRIPPRGAKGGGKVPRRGPLHYRLLPPRPAGAEKSLPFSQKMSSLFPKICGIMTLDSIAGRSGGRDRAGARPRRSTQAGRRRSAPINHAGGMSHE